MLLSAFIVGFESVAIEGALNIAKLDLFLVSSVPTLVGGLILMSIYPKRTVAFCRELGKRGWLFMFALCSIAAIGIILWFDAVGRIGAGKEAILGGGSSEVLFVVVLSAIFLSERLRLLEAIGSLLVILGVFVVLANTETMNLTLGLGEAEAILSSLCLGTSVVMTTILIKNRDLTAFSGVELLLSGMIVITASVLGGLITVPDLTGLLIVFLLGLFPAMGLLTYNAGLPKIGASLTSVLFALNGIMTVGVQLLVLGVFPGANITLPQSVALAVSGGVVAFIGVYLLEKGDSSKNAHQGQ